jgi:hypothetical protein
MNAMDRLAELGEALSPVDVPEDRLRARIAAGRITPVATQTGWVRPTLVAVAAAVAAVIAGAILVGSPPGGGLARSTDIAVNAQPAAFTLSVNADGSVTFTAHDVVDAVAATQALNDAGITGRVINDTPESSANCPTKNGDIKPEDLYPDDHMSRGFRDSDTVTVRTSDYPPGGGLLLIVMDHDELVARKRPPLPVVLGILAFDDAAKIPTCLDGRDQCSGCGWPRTRPPASRDQRQNASSGRSIRSSGVPSMIFRSEVSRGSTSLAKNRAAATLPW